MALLWLSYETDAIYVRVRKEVEGIVGQRRACHKSVAFIAACLPALRRISLAAFKPAHNLSLSVALDQNQ